MVTVLPNMVTKNRAKLFESSNEEIPKTLIQKTKERKGKITNTAISLSRSLVNLKKRKSVVKGEPWRRPQNREDQKEKR